MRVAVVILNWNGWQATAACVDAVEGLDHADVSLVVVDNGSTDGSVSFLRERYPTLRLLESGANLGFAGGMNVALRQLLEESEPEYIWLLNNDARPSPGALTALIDVAEHDPRVGAVGSVLLGGALPSVWAWGGGTVSFRTGLPRHHREPVTPDRIDYLVGASLLLRARALRELGLLDDRFFLYWEDTDISYRLRDAGWKLAVAPDSLVLHEGNGSLAFQSPGWDREFTASSVIFFRQHARFPWAPILISSTGRILLRTARGRWANSAATWQGLRRGLAAS